MATGAKTKYRLALAAYSAARGVKAVVFFGMLWLLGGVELSLRTEPPREFRASVACLALGAAAAMVLFLRARRTRGVTRELATAPGNSQAQGRRSRNFLLVNIGQYALIGASCAALVILRRTDLIVSAVVFIVGAHFVPLAKLFKNPRMYLTGGVLMAWALLYPHVLPIGGWNPLGLSVTGLLLVGSGMWSSIRARGMAERATGS